MRITFSILFGITITSSIHTITRQITPITPFWFLLCNFGHVFLAGWLIYSELKVLALFSHISDIITHSHIFWVKIFVGVFISVVGLLPRIIVAAVLGSVSDTLKTVYEDAGRAYFIVAIVMGMLFSIYVFIILSNLLDQRNVSKKQWNQLSIPLLEKLKWVCLFNLVWTTTLYSVWIYGRTLSDPHLRLGMIHIGIVALYHHALLLVYRYDIIIKIVFPKGAKTAVNLHNPN
jgi:hypothetical protein